MLSLPCTCLLCPRNQAPFLQESTRLSNKDTIILLFQFVSPVFLGSLFYPIALIWPNWIHLLGSLFLPSTLLPRLFCLQEWYFSSCFPSSFQFTTWRPSSLGEASVNFIQLWPKPTVMQIAITKKGNFLKEVNTTTKPKYIHTHTHSIPNPCGYSWNNTF